MDIPMTENCKYESIAGQISAECHVPASRLLLFMNRQLVPIGTQFRASNDTPDINLTALNPDDFPLRSFPDAEWLFPWDMRKFGRPAGHMRFPTNFPLEARRRSLRQLVPNVGYECANPGVSGPTLNLPPRSGHPDEVREIIQEKAGEMEELYAREDEYDSVKVLAEFRENMTVEQGRSLGRLLQSGLDLDFVTYVYLRNDCDEETAFWALSEA
jgi:hypothetical protein